MIKKIWKFIVEYHEILSVPFIFGLLYFSPVFFRWLDPSAGEYDLGKLQKIFYAVTAFLIINLVVWFIMKVEHPRLYQQDEAKDYEGLFQWHRIYIRFLYYALYLVAIILLAIIL